MALKRNKKLTNIGLLALAGLIIVAVIYSCKRQEINATKTNSETNVRLKTDYVSIYVSPGTIADHGDPTIPNSLAWYIAQNGGGTSAGTQVTYWLASGTYNFKHRIIMPDYATIARSGTGAKPELVLVTGYDNSGSNHEFIRTGVNGALVHIAINLDWKASNGVFIPTGGDGAIISDVIIQKSYKFNAPSDPAGTASTLIYTNANNVLITHCLLRRAGVDSDEEDVKQGGDLIKVEGGDHVTVEYCNMAVAAQAGIAFLTGKYLTVDHDSIFDTGRSLSREDGITSYHVQTGTTDRHVVITNNTVFNCRNHGVHVAGYGIDIENNKIYDAGYLNKSAGSNIFIGDYNTVNTVCSANFTVKNNDLSNCPNGGGYALLVEHWTSGKTISGNSYGSCGTSIPPSPDCP